VPENWHASPRRSQNECDAERFADERFHDEVRVQPCVVAGPPTIKSLNFA